MAAGGREQREEDAEVAEEGQHQPEGQRDGDGGRAQRPQARISATR